MEIFLERGKTPGKELIREDLLGNIDKKKDMH